MKFKAILWTYHKTKSGEYPIKIRIVNTIDGRTITKYHPLNILVRKDEWDKKNGRVKFGNNAQEINLKIIETCNSIEKNYIESGQAAVGKHDELNWWMEEYHKNAKLKHGTYYVKMLNTVKNILKEYLPHIPLRSFNTKFLTDFERHLLEKGYHVNYVANILIRVKSVVKEAVKAGAMEYHKNPFLNFKVKQIKTDRQRLQYSDIVKLEKVKLSDSVELARDMYIFSFYCGGIRFGDLCRLNKSNYDNGRLIYTVSKTNVNRNIKLNDKALAVFKKYGYCFPTGVNWKDEDVSISAKNALLNKYLKQACEKAKIPKISFHSSRNSIADYAIKKKLSPREIQGILGHTTFNTTEVYLRSFYQEENDEVMDKLFKN